MSVLRLIPSIDAVLQRESLQRAASRYGSAEVADAARRSAGRLRDHLKAPQTGERLPDSEAGAAQWIESATLEQLEGRIRPSLQPVINATGVIIHTNLGRAPLAGFALQRAAEVGAGYANLEYDLTAGTRGHRHVHAERLLCELTGAEAALVANNNASATMLVLAALAHGREVLVSRGELVEIGGGFRVPDVMAQSGARLREVGTTNRTRVSDYAAAIGDHTGLLLRVHPSNFRIEGFTERPALPELATVAHRFDLPLFEDLGSGWLGLHDVATPSALGDEPSVRRSLDDGADLVSFSGDKLLGGPQAGIIVGRHAVVEQIRSHPLMRAVRVDKLTYAALEATLALWAEPARRLEIPVFRMLVASVEELERRARDVAATLHNIEGLDADVNGGFSTTGGGSAPESALPTILLRITTARVSVAELDRRLRAANPPVVARIEREQLTIDLRTVMPSEDGALANALARSARAL